MASNILQSILKSPDRIQMEESRTVSFANDPQNCDSDYDDDDFNFFLEPDHSENLKRESLVILTKNNTNGNNSLTRNQKITPTMNSQVNTRVKNVENLNKKRSKCPSSKNIRKRLNENYGKIYGSYFTKFPLKRLAREQEKARKRNVSRRKIWDWVNPSLTDNILNHTDQTVWFRNVLKATGGKGKEIVVSKSMLENRKKLAKFLAHMNFLNLKESMQGNELLFQKSLSGHSHDRKFTATPTKNVLFVVMDMTKDDNFIQQLKGDGSFKEISDNSGYLYITVSGIETVVYVPVVIMKMKTLLDFPESSWKSFSGTRNATEKVFADRNGIHSCTLQLLDKQIEESKDDIEKKLIVVHDERIEFSEDSDVVNCFVQDIKCVLAHRIGSQHIVSGENVE